MKYKCSNGHENFADALPERCPNCASTLLKVVSGSAVTAPAGAASGAAPRTSPLASAPSGAWRAEAQPPLLPPDAPRRRKPVWLFVVVGVVALGVLGVLGGLLFLLLGRNDTDHQMAAMASQYENAVGVVIIAGQKNGQSFSTPIATAWAVGDRFFVSNGHVAEPVARALTNGAAAFIVLNKNPEKKFRVLEAIAHPKYGEKLLNIAGKDPAVPAYDVGLLRVDASVPNKFKVAPEAELRKLGSGYRVAYLGFPMENLSGGGVDPANPVANMQSGIITSTTDYWLSKAPFEKSLLLSHNLAAAGGASGSPIFNAAGQVVGVLSAGNIAIQMDAQSGQPTRTPSAALINFAQRIDLLRDFTTDYSK